MAKAKRETPSGTEVTAMLGTLPQESVHQIIDYLPLEMILTSDSYNQKNNVWAYLLFRTEG